MRSKFPVKEMPMPDIYERPSVRFCRIDVANAEEVADFILWLCYRNRAANPSQDPIEFDERPDPEKQLEDSGSSFNKIAPKNISISAFDSTERHWRKIVPIVDTPSHRFKPG
jgi:hypothetical protein